MHDVQPVGNSGRDTLIGGAVLDTFVFGVGSGRDTVIDASTQGGIVQLDAGLPLSALSATRDGQDLRLRIVGDGDDSLRTANDSIREKAACAGHYRIKAPQSTEYLPP